MVGQKEKLGKVLTLNYGWSLPESKRVAGDYSVYGSNGIVGYHHEPLVSSPGLIVGRKGSAGNVHYSQKPFCPIDTTFFVAPSDTPLDIEFLFYLLRYIDLKRILGDVGVPGLNREVAYREKAIFPTERDEQRKIASVLSLAQRAIEQQERLIALTTELKKSLMHKLFTEGLRGERQKQTEIGPVPESWEVVSLGAMCNLGTGTTPSTKNPAYYCGDIPFVKTAEIVNNRIQSTEIRISKEAVEDCHLRVYPPGTVLMAMYGQGKTRGQVGLLEIDACTTQNSAAIQPRGGMDSEFLWQYLRSCYGKLRGAGAEGHISHLNLGYLGNFRVIKPSLAEQQEIAGILRTVDERISRSEQNQRLLQHLFRTLLHQLMTAQIRVHDLDLSFLEQETVGS